MHHVQLSLTTSRPKCPASFMLTHAQALICTGLSLQAPKEIQMPQIKEVNKTIAVPEIATAPATVKVPEIPDQEVSR